MRTFFTSWRWIAPKKQAWSRFSTICTAINPERIRGWVWFGAQVRSISYHTIWQHFAPTVSVIGSYSLTQQLSFGSLRWFLCACSAGSEKPDETKRYPLWTQGSKTCQHGILVGVFFWYQWGAIVAGFSTQRNDVCIDFEFQITLKCSRSWVIQAHPVFSTSKMFTSRFASKICPF